MSNDVTISQLVEQQIKSADMAIAECRKLLANDLTCQDLAETLERLEENKARLVQRLSDLNHA